MKQIVIEIPDEVYNYIKNRGHIPPHMNIAPEIANGTVLPEGHGDLIDRDALELPSEEMVSKMIIFGATAIIEADK